LDDLIPGLVGLAIIVGLFFLLRVIVLWYWQIDKITNALNSIDNRLRDVTSILSSVKDNTNNLPRTVNRICPNCKEQVDNDSKFCFKCGRLLDE